MSADSDAMQISDTPAKIDAMEVEGGEPRYV
jgi:hypothetical protein